MALYAILIIASSASAFALTMHFRPKLSKLQLFSIFGSFLFFCTFYISGLARGQDQIDILKIAPSILLFAIGILGAPSLLESGISPISLWNRVIAATFAGMLLNFLLVAAIDGIDFSTIRYQVLTGATPLICAHVIVRLVFGGMRPWTLVMTFVYLAFVILSVTRTHMAVAMAVLSFVLIFSGFWLLRSGRIALQGVMVIMFVLVGIALGLYLPGAPIERWAERLTVAQQHNGLDVTAITRVGEANYQINQLKSSISGLFFGFGAAPNSYDDANARIIAFLLGEKAAYYSEIGIGHNNYVGSLYVAGIVGGGTGLLVQFLTLLHVGPLIRKIIQNSNSETLALLSAPLGVVAFMTYGLLGGTMGSRSACLTFGLAIGFTLWLCKTWKTPAILARRSGPIWRSAQTLRMRPEFPPGG